eukprot:57245-Chlamydomonas_euryale.AAC.2
MGRGWAPMVQGHTIGYGQRICEPTGPRSTFEAMGSGWLPHSPGARSRPWAVDGSPIFRGYVRGHGQWMAPHSSGARSRPWAGDGCPIVRGHVRGHGQGDGSPIVRGHVRGHGQGMASDAAAGH